MTVGADGEVARARMNIRPGHEWDKFEGLSQARPSSKRFSRRAVQQEGPPPSDRARDRRAAAACLQAGGADVDAAGLWAGAQRDRARRHELAARIVTPRPTSPSRPISAPGSTAAACSRAENHDCSGRRRSLDLQLGFSPKGQHLELGIAEMNLFIMLSALGLSHAINGERLLPIGTLYDPFIERGLDALNYACYQDARFMVVATPSGITLAPEGGAHQSIATPLIGMAQDGLASFEPAFVDELAVIMGWGFD
jgi:pyruvate dehydrogenase E1 component